MLCCLPNVGWAISLEPFGVAETLCMCVSIVYWQDNEMVHGVVIFMVVMVLCVLMMVLVRVVMVLVRVVMVLVR